mgnify:CR=1 FL=1
MPKAASVPNGVRKFLDLSTGHLPVSDRVLMASSALETLSFSAFPGVYGWFVHVPEEGTPARWNGSDALDTVFARARELDCDYVLLDADGPRDEALPWFDED